MKHSGIPVMTKPAVHNLELNCGALLQYKSEGSFRCGRMTGTLHSDFTINNITKSCYLILFFKCYDNKNRLMHNVLLEIVTHRIRAGFHQRPN